MKRENVITTLETSGWVRIGVHLVTDGDEDSFDIYRHPGQPNVVVHLYMHTLQVMERAVRSTFGLWLTALIMTLSDIVSDGSGWLYAGPLGFRLKEQTA